jgi:L,D-transpeptidase catalytic domain
MIYPLFTRPLIFAFSISVIVSSCNWGNKKIIKSPFQYQRFKDSLFKSNQADPDTSNVFDGKYFTPGIDSVNNLLIRYDTLLHRDAYFLEHLDTVIKKIKKQASSVANDKVVIKENIEMLDSFLMGQNLQNQSKCNGRECFLYAEINKSTQTLYLYILGELKDSFRVSTGIKKHETPNLNLSPRGPLLIKYKSKKYPGGNYFGLGNMPYAVFLRGGYAIHGTTPGNFSRLGTRASHGCIRLHPDNARLFYELVKVAGLSQTWVTIRDSLP